jgi:hypothetical protein
MTRNNTNDRNELVYLAIPYSHCSTDVKTYRAMVASYVAGKLMKEGTVVFSPISHGHLISEIHQLPTDWKYWEKHCKTFLYRCDKLIVVMADGWKESKGVAEEIAIAAELGLPIEYYSVEDIPNWLRYCPSYC